MPYPPENLFSTTALPRSTYLAPSAPGRTADPHVVLNGVLRPSDFRCVVERETPCLVIRLGGVLDRASAPALRAYVADFLVGRPPAVLLDVSELLVDEPAALPVFAAVAGDVARWSGTALALYGAGPTTAAALRQSPTCRHLPVFPTLEAAMAGIENDTTPGQLTARLLPVAGAARQARELVTEACARWDVPQLVGPACTVVTELVNNAVVHARTPMDVMLRLRERYLNISVRDGSLTAPQARGPASPSAPGGRGLMMVEAVAQRWGYTPVEYGKVVWAVLRIDDGWTG